MSENNTLPFAKGFRELRVYQRQRELSRRIFELTKKFPPEERFALTDQIHRSARSIGAQIAEAWGKRDYKKHFASKLTDAASECHETEHWIETTSDCAYLDAMQTTELLGFCDEIGRMLRIMRERSSSFCSTIREEPDDFY